MSVAKLPASNNMTVEQALNSALLDADELKEVMIIGTKTNGEHYRRSSKIFKRDVLWLLKEAELDLLGR